MQATMTGAVPVWTAVRLSDVRTDVLAGLDLRHAPAPGIARVIRAELTARRAESRAA